MRVLLKDMWIPAPLYWAAPRLSLFVTLVILIMAPTLFVLGFATGLYGALVLGIRQH